MIRKRSGGRNHDNLRDQERNNAPSVEIFGGVFALLLVLFLLINTFSQASLQERLSDLNEGGAYKVDWGPQGSGYVVIAFPGELRIVETSENVRREDVCDKDGAFVRYARKLYQKPGKQIVFTILENSVATMAAARNCMMRIMPGKHLTIGWIIADRELLKSVSLDDLPPYVEEVIRERAP